MGVNDGESCRCPVSGGVKLLDSRRRKPVKVVSVTNHVTNTSGVTRFTMTSSQRFRLFLNEWADFVVGARAGVRRDRPYMEEISVRIE